MLFRSIYETDDPDDPKRDAEVADFSTDACALSPLSGWNVLNNTRASTTSWSVSGRHGARSPLVCFSKINALHLRTIGLSYNK